MDIIHIDDEGGVAHLDQDYPDFVDFVEQLDQIGGKDVVKGGGVVTAAFLGAFRSFSRCSARLGMIVFGL